MERYGHKRGRDTDGMDEGVKGHKENGMGGVGWMG